MRRGYATSFRLPAETSTGPGGKGVSRLFTHPCMGKEALLGTLEGQKSADNLAKKGRPWALLLALPAPRLEIPNVTAGAKSQLSFLNSQVGRGKGQSWGRRRRGAVALWR